MTIVNNNPWITSYSLIEELIKTYVTDINTTRRNLSTSQEKQWIFPYYPEKNNNYYPIVGLFLTNINYTESSAGRYDSQNTSASDVDVKYSNLANLDIVITTFTKKKEVFSVTLPGESTAKSIKGSLLNAYLTGEIAKQLDKNVDYLYSNNVEYFNISSITPAYKDNENLWASNISINLTLPNIWGNTYTASELITVINKNYTVSLT